MTRLLTREHFQSETTIDGNRLDRAIANMVSRFNRIREGDRQHRWVERTFSTHWHPNSASYGSPFKCASMPNATLWAGLPISIPSTNIHKWKGHAVPEVGDFGELRAWGTSWSSSRRSRLRRVVATCLQIEPYETYDWQYGATAPEGSSNGDFINDIAVEVLVMNPSAIERRDKASLVLLRERFRASAQLLYPKTPLPAAPTNMLPAMPTPGYPYGLVIDVEVDVPLPPYARCVAGLIIPNYAAAGFNWPWPAREPWAVGHWSKSITLLEPA